MNAKETLEIIIAKCRRVMFGVTIFSLAINVLMLTAPFYMLQVFDRVMTSRSVETLLLLTVIAMTALWTLGALDLVRTIVFVRIGRWIDGQAGETILTASIIDALDRNRDASIQGLRDLSTVRGFLTGPGVFPILDAPWAPIFLAAIFLLHPWLGLLALAGAVVLFTLALTNDLATRTLLQRANAASARAMNKAQTATRNAEALEAMGMTSGIVRQWRDENAIALAYQSDASVRSGAIAATSKFLRLALQVGVLGLGAYLAITDALTPGSMIAASILMSRALAPVESAIGSWRSAVAAHVVYRRLRDRLTKFPPRGAAMPLPVPKSSIDVEGVGFAYRGADEFAIRNVSFSLRPGEIVGLVGPSASGKSTLARLLVGIAKPGSGHVRLDGREISTWEPDDRGRHIGYLPQDVELLTGTVRENISRMGDAEPDAVVAAAQAAGAHEMILRLPLGYDTPIGDNGAALSGGQRQRIALARAVFGQPAFIVLDEPSSNLDSKGEDALQVTLMALRIAGTAIAVIAHRPSVLRIADKIVVLENGAIRMMGPPKEVFPKVTREQISPVEKAT